MEAQNNLKKVLFIDRDGTLVIEPPVDYQLDSLDKLEFYPGVFRNMYNISKNLDYELVIVSNQDGLGTSSFPEDTFWPAQNKMLKAFENESVCFDDILIDRSMPNENSPNRKPRTGMMNKYINGQYDLTKSYVIGDRITDIELAKNLGCKAIWLSDQSDDILKEKNLSESCVLKTTSWDDIYAEVSKEDRTANIIRKTKETDIRVFLDLDGKGKADISTGLGFFDHMLEQIARHSGMDLTITTNGDLNVDEHHTIEDTAIALGEAILKALGNKIGIERYGFCLPMDDSIIEVAIDFGGRPWLVWNTDFKREKIGDMPTEMFKHFFKSLSDSAKCNLYIKAEGDNEHHKIEGIFKAFAKSLKMAKKRDVFNFQLPSTKGSL
ncbi:MAG: bifunctional histidinol-phosphatase/imidazoleglycerol-phosphate dehydratase HisB [Prolixibacteraceae bacterium]|nr:bifunctional histidinol-phosphatase/imidazoleglycerol-phosphate dehydratase HisB [Prolixibacteraceae bacterium]